MEEMLYSDIYDLERFFEHLFFADNWELDAIPSGVGEWQLEDILPMSDSGDRFWLKYSKKNLDKSVDTLSVDFSRSHIYEIIRS